MHTRPTKTCSLIACHVDTMSMTKTACLCPYVHHHSCSTCWCDWHNLCSYNRRSNNFRSKVLSYPQNTYHIPKPLCYSHHCLGWLSHSVSAAREVLFDSRAGSRSSHVSCRLLHRFVAHYAMRKLLLRLCKTCTGASVDAVHLLARKRTIIDPHSLYDKNTCANSECDVTTKLQALTLQI